MASKAKKTADASTAQDASTEGSEKERSFPHLFGSQDAHRSKHMLRLVLTHYRLQKEAFTDETARAAFKVLNNVLMAQGKAGAFAIFDAAQKTGVPLQQIEILSTEMREFKADWPTNKAKVQAFIDENRADIKALEGKTEFDSLK